MKNKKVMYAITVLCSLILPLLVGTAIAFQSPNSINSNNTEDKITPQDITVWTIGNSESLSSFVDTVNSQGAKVAPVDIQSLDTDIDLQSEVLNKRSILIFDGTWIEQNDNQQLYGFLSTNVKDIGGIIVTGESATDLYLILEKASLYSITRDEKNNLRTPVSEDVTIAGFALKEAMTPNGEVYYVPSHFSTSSTDSYLVMKDITDWLNVDCRRSPNIELIEETILQNREVWLNTGD